MKLDVDDGMKIANGVAVVAGAEKLPRLKKLTLDLIGHVDNVQRFADVCPQIRTYATRLDTRFPDDHTLGKCQSHFSCIYWMFHQILSGSSQSCQL